MTIAELSVRRPVTVTMVYNILIITNIYSKVP